jgi:hypothetical protein
MTLRPHDERYNPRTREWTCPGCLRRVDWLDRSFHKPHLCVSCSEARWDLCRRDRQAREGATGLRWVYPGFADWTWDLYRGRTWLGCVSRYPRPWVACDAGLKDIEVGTLAECARALVAAVTR